MDENYERMLGSFLTESLDNLMVRREIMENATTKASLAGITVYDALSEAIFVIGERRQSVFYAEPLG